MNPTWQSDCGTVSLWCGDCLDVMRTWPDGCVDAVVTDPPYGVGFRYNTHDDRREGYEAWCAQWFGECKRTSRTIMLSCGMVNVSMWSRICPFKWIVAWLKPAAMGRSPLGFCNWEPMLVWGKTPQASVDVFTAGIRPSCELSGHPCPKPLEWGTNSVERVSLDGDLIADPFMGSGTTGVAAVRLGRRFWGIELDPGYFEIAKKRIQEELRRQSFLEGKLTKETTPSMFEDWGDRNRDVVQIGKTAKDGTL